MWLLAPSFIELWVGAEYLIDDVSLALVVAILFINLSRGAVDAFITAYGLFQDIWAPITEAALNVGLAVLLGWFWGLPGILAGVLISLVAIIFVWKPCLLFRRGFRLPVRGYAVMYLRHAAVLTAVFAGGIFLARFIPVDPAGSWLGFICYAASVTAIFTLVMGGLLYATERGMRDFVERMVLMLNRKK